MSVAYLFVLILLFLLAPYLSLGVVVNSGLLSIVMLLALAPGSVVEVTRQQWFWRYSLLFGALGAYSGIMVSMLGGPDYSFLKVMISLGIYMIMGFAIGRYLRMRGLDGAQTVTLLVKLALATIVLNSVIVIVSFLVPPFKGAVESLLADASNMDYKNLEFKLRGVASAGGAGLAVLHGLGIWIALALYRHKQIGILVLTVSCGAIVAAMMFIGRTGFIVVALALLIFVVTTTNTRNLWRLFIVFTVAGVSLAVVWNWLSELLPSAILDYSILFLFQGVEGISNEGTVAQLQQELFIPDSIWQLLFGIGYYNGDNILHITSDPGYMKSLLSLGLPLAILLYLSLIRFFIPLLRSVEGRLYALPLVLLLLIVEIKEPFFYSGYSARLVFMLGGAWLAYETLGVRLSSRAASEEGGGSPASISNSGNLVGVGASSNVGS